MGLKNIFAVYRPTGELIQRLDGPPRFFGEDVFIPSEKFITRERFEPSLRLLSMVSEMEVLAWASK